MEDPFVWNFFEVLTEALVDSVKMLPFLFIAYLCIEYVEVRHGERIERLLARRRTVGCHSRCTAGLRAPVRFSAVASNFYSSRVITLGTLMAVYLATSDEGDPLLASMPAYWDKLAILIALKGGVCCGSSASSWIFVLRGLLPRSLQGGYTGRADEVDCHEDHADAQGNPRRCGRLPPATPWRSLRSSLPSACCAGWWWKALARTYLPMCWAGWASSSRW